MWKECGHLSIFLGLEKIDDDGLKSVNKKNRAVNNDRAIEILQQLDVGYTPNFIIDPDWDRDHFAKLRDWVDRNRRLQCRFLDSLTPLPGTDLWDEVQQQINTPDWELFDIAHTVLPTKLSQEEFYSEYAGLWRHALETRYKHCGKVRTYVEMGAALATGKLTFSALKKRHEPEQAIQQPRDLHQRASRQRVENLPDRVFRGHSAIGHRRPPQSATMILKDVAPEDAAARAAPRSYSRRRHAGTWLLERPKQVC